MQDEKNTPESKPQTNTGAELKQAPLSYGQKLVGLTFNPSGDAKVNRAKLLCAELADLVKDYGKNEETTEFTEQFRKQALHEILNAQMCSVKLLTCKY